MPALASHAPTSPSTQSAAPVLVDAEWLVEHLDAVRVVDTRRAGEYLGGHVPGACSFALDALLIEDTSRAATRKLASAAQDALDARGIGPADHVVLVDDGDGSAALGATICELAGMASVSLLHGGISSFGSVGGALETQLAQLVAGAGGFADVEPRLDHVATFEELVHASAAGDAVVIDARAQLEHEGMVGAPCCASRGAIPGSTHLEWTSLIDMSGKPLGADRVQQVADHLGVPLDAEIILYCHAGHRAAVAARVLRAAGLPRVRVSLGSWHEWAGRGMPSQDGQPGD